MLKDITIQSLATASAYNRGCRDYEMGMVKDLRKESASLPAYRATVENPGGDANSARATLSRKGDSVEAFSCDCPSAAVHLEACHHVVALMKAVQGEQRETESSKRRTSVKREMQRKDYEAGERMLRIFGAAAAEEREPQIAASVGWNCGSASRGPTS